MKKKSNNRFNLTNPLARLCAVEDEAQTAPSPTGTDLQVKRMFNGRGAFAPRTANLILARAILGA